MTSTITSLADRVVGFLAPKASARAACVPYAKAAEKFCYCQGIRMYTRTANYLDAQCHIGAFGPCKYIRDGCA